MEQKMTFKLIEKLSFLVVTSILAMSTAAYAGTSFVADRDDIEDLCFDEDGRFEMSYAYDDKGVQYGPTWTCNAERIKVECRDGVCRMFQITNHTPDVG